MFLDDNNINNLIIDDVFNPANNIVLGKIDNQFIGMPIENLDKGIYISGIDNYKAKLNLLEWISYSLIKNNKSLILMEPTGNLVDKVLADISRLAPERADDIVLLDFNNNIAFNPLDINSIEQLESRSYVIQETVMNMLNLKPEYTPNAVRYLIVAIKAMLEYNIDNRDKLTLLDVIKFFTNKDFRELVVSNCNNSDIKDVFGNQGSYSVMNERYQLDHIMPILRMFSLLETKNSFIRTYNQMDSKVDFVKYIKEQKIILIKLPIKASEYYSSKFIGTMLSSMIMESIVNLDDDTYFISDEFQNYITGSYKDLILSEDNYNLHPIFSNSFPQELPLDFLKAIQLNIPNKITMRLDFTGANEIAEFISLGHNKPTIEDLTKLRAFSAWANILTKEYSIPFLFETLDSPLDFSLDNKS